MGLRKYKRKIAHALMAKEGILRPNKAHRFITVKKGEKVGNPSSYFSRHWREYFVGESKKRGKKR